MNIERKERGQYPIVQVAYLPMPCMHCDAAPCLTADGAVYKRDDGLVIIDPVKAKGRKEIVDSCPYGAIYWNEEAGVAQKCTGCVHLLEDGWTETRCSQVCPTGAIKLVLAEDAEMAKMAAAEGLQVFKPELGTKPRVYYKNLYRWEKVFVSASVAFKDTDECAEGAKVDGDRRRQPKVGDGRGQQLRRVRRGQAGARQRVRGGHRSRRLQAVLRARHAGQEPEPRSALPRAGLSTEGGARATEGDGKGRRKTEVVSRGRAGRGRATPSSARSPAVWAYSPCSTSSTPSGDLNDICSRTGMSKTTAYRMVRTLEAMEFVAYDAQTERYHLGKAMIPAAYLTMSYVGFVRAAHPFLERAVRGDRRDRGADRRGSREEPSWWTKCSHTPVPAQSAHRPPAEHTSPLSSFRMHLAFCPLAEQRKILAKGQPALTPHTMTDPDELIERMAAERAEGLALDIEEQDLRVCAVSAPVLERDGSLRAVLTVVAPAERFGSRERKKTSEAVRNAAAANLRRFLNGGAISD